MNHRKIYLKRSFLIWLLALVLLWLFRFIPLNLTDFVGNANKIPTEPYDLYAQYEANSSVSKLDNRIVIINIPDEANRGEIAEALEELAKCNPSVVGLDFIFPEQKDSISDAHLSGAINSFGNKIAIASFYDGQQMMRSFFADSISVYEGCANADVKNKYDVIRTFVPLMEFEGKITPSLAYIVSSIYTNKKNTENFNPNDRAYIYWKSVKFPIIDAENILDCKAKIENKIVLVGSFSHEDVHRTSIASDYNGVKVIAHSIRNIIDNDFIWHSSLLNNVLCGLILLISSFIIQYFECNGDERYSDCTSFVSFLMQILLLIGVVVFGGYKLYQLGIYIDFTMLLLGILVYPIINDSYNVGKRLFDVIKRKILKLKELKLK